MTSSYFPSEISTPPKTRSNAPSSKDAELLGKAVEVCREAASGNLEPRILGVAEAEGDMAELCRMVNHLLDMTDAFVREASASLEHVANDKFHRRVVLRGMRGSFRRAAEVINHASDQMGQRSRELEAVKARQLEMADQFEQRVMTVAESVAAASTELQASASTLSANASEALRDSEASVNAAENTTLNVKAVADAATPHSPRQRRQWRRAGWP